MDLVDYLIAEIVVILVVIAMLIKYLKEEKDE